jgi:16S rRNA (guanine527-N7)-methyltransferase
MSGESLRERRDLLPDALARGAAALGLTLDSDRQRRLIAFLDLLGRWNRVYNLTAVADPQRMLVLHLLDSLSVASDLRGPRVLDVGTGPGLPGLPLSVAHPHWEFVLLDSGAKKIRFLTQAVAELDLRNVVAVRARVQDYRAPPFDTIVSRAFSSLPRFLSAVAHLTGPGGRIVAMKGRLPSDELSQVPSTFAVEAVRRLHVPGLDAERHLVTLCAKAGGCK